MLKKTAVILHLFVVLALILGHFEKPKPYPHHLSLRSIHLKPALKKTTNSAPKTIKQNQPPSSKTTKAPTAKPKNLKPSTKTNKVLKESDKKQQPVTKPIKKEAETLKKPEKKTNLEALQETIAKIEEKLDKLDQCHKLDPTPTDSFVDTNLSQDDDQTLALFSSQGIIEYLFQLLELPEKGKVNVEIKLNNLGIIEEVKILHSESDKNSLYLLQNLKNLQIPFSKKEKIPSSLNVVFSNLNA